MASDDFSSRRPIPSRRDPRAEPEEEGPAPISRVEVVSLRPEPISRRRRPESSAPRPAPISRPDPRVEPGAPTTQRSPEAVSAPLDAPTSAAPDPSTRPPPVEAPGPSSLSFAGELDLEAPRSSPTPPTSSAPQPSSTTAFVATSTLTGGPSVELDDRLCVEVETDTDNVELGVELAHEALAREAPPPSEPGPKTSRSAQLTVASPTPTAVQPAKSHDLGLPISLGVLGAALIAADVAAGSAARWEGVRLAWIGVGITAAAVLLLFWRLLDNEPR